MGAPHPFDSPEGRRPVRTETLVIEELGRPGGGRLPNAKVELHLAPGLFGVRCVRAVDVDHAAAHRLGRETRAAEVRTEVVHEGGSLIRMSMAAEPRVFYHFDNQWGLVDPQNEWRGS